MSEASDEAKEAALEQLAKIRADIERIDHEIISLLAERLVLGKQTAELKRIAGLPILDPTREAAVIRRVTTAAREAGLPPEPIREVFWQIVGMSRREQEAQ
jgi:chorismate mutase/prephenate dehydrogenase